MSLLSFVLFGERVKYTTSAPVPPSYLRIPNTDKYRSLNEHSFLLLDYVCMIREIAFCCL